MQTRREALFTGLAAAVAALWPWKQPSSAQESGFDANTLKCSEPVVKQESEYVWKVVYQFEHRPNGWTPKLLVFEQEA